MKFKNSRHTPRPTPFSSLDSTISVKECHPYHSGHSSNFHLNFFNFDFSHDMVMGHGSWVMGHGSWVMGHGSWVMGHGTKDGALTPSCKTQGLDANSYHVSYLVSICGVVGI